MQDKKIKDFDKEDFRNLHIIFLKWAKFLGIKEVPDEEQIVMLIIFVREHFNNFTIPMVKDAFNLAIARKLPNVEPEHYQNFSPVYVGGILKAYYDFTERARRAYLSASGNVDADQFEVKKSDVEQGMPALVKLCLEDPERIGTSGQVVYDYLVELQLLELSNEEKKGIMEQAKIKATEDAKKELKGESLNKILKSIDKHPKSKDTKVITLCKKIGLSIYLDKLGSEGRNNLLKNVESKSNDRLATLRKQEQKN